MKCDIRLIYTISVEVKRRIKMKESIKKNGGLFFVTIVLNIITAIASVMIAKLLQKVIDAAVNGDMSAFQRVLILSIGYILLLGFINYLYSYFSKKFIYKVIRLFRERIFMGILRRRTEDFTAVNSADYISALTNDTKLVEDNFLLPLLLTLQYGVMFLVTSVLLVQISPLITGCLFVALLFMFVLPGMIGQGLQAKQNEVSSRLADFTTALKDFFSGFEVIKSYQMEKSIKSKFTNKNNLSMKAKFGADKLLALNEGVSGILAYITQFAGLFIGAYFIIQGKLSAGTLVALVQLSGTFISPVMMIFQNIPKIQGAKPIISRLRELEEFENNDQKDSKIPTFQKEICVKDLGFSYEGNRAVFCDLNLSFEKGKKYAIVGKSGCGKSTLVRLIAGQLSGYEGEVQFDGEELSHLNREELESMISVISQNVYMFDETVKDNITLYETFGENEMKRALVLSGVIDFLDKLPEEIDTQVGENGSNLSGGQRQRIAVARALIRNKNILVLDEGTSAVDKMTAHEIENRLLAMKELTLFTITHNLNEELLANYDQILFMEEGGKVVVGTLDELRKNNSSFASFYGH